MAYTREQLNAMSEAELKSAYKSARRNLLRNVRKMEKQGAVFDRDMRPEIPKEIKPGSVMKLQTLNAQEYRYRHATVKDIETGKQISWNKYAREKRKASARIGAFTRKHNKQKGQVINYIPLVNAKVEWMVSGVLTGTARSSTSIHEAQATLLMWEQIKDVNGDSDTLKIFLKENVEDILECLDIMYQESDREEVKEAFSRLSQIFESAMGSLYNTIDAETFQQKSGGWSVYFKEE